MSYRIDLLNHLYLIIDSFPGKNNVEIKRLFHAVVKCQKYLIRQKCFFSSCFSRHGKGLWTIFALCVTNGIITHQNIVFDKSFYVEVRS